MKFLFGGEIMYEKKIAKANWTAEAYYGLYGIVSDVEYILERNRYGMWDVYDFDGHYITECRTDCFDDYRDYY